MRYATRTIAAVAVAVLGSFVVAVPSFATSRPTAPKPTPVTTTTTTARPIPPAQEEDPIIETQSYPPTGSHAGMICDYYLSGRVLCRPYSGPPVKVYPKLPRLPGGALPPKGTYVDPPKMGLLPSWVGRIA